MTCPATDLKHTTCRICIQNSENEMYSIFSLDAGSNNLHIYEKIEECSGIKIIRHDKIPTQICKNCYAFLTISYKFRSICRNSNEYYQEIVTSLPPEHQSEPLECKPNIKDEIVAKKVKKPKVHKQKTERASSVPPVVNDKTILNDSRSSLVHSEGENEVIYEEMWLEGEQTEDATESSNQLQIVSIEKLPEHNVENEKEIVEFGNTPSKEIGISSDGAAVIRDKKPMPKGRKGTKEKRPHICDICGNVYKLRYALMSHMRRHRKEKPFACEICGQAFHCNFELSRHIRKHTGSRPYRPISAKKTCSFCKRTFGDRSTLTKHERIHRNERPYKCDTCGKSFTYSSVLKSHLLTHTGEKPYNCELCGKSFSRGHHLRAHLETLQHQNDPLSKILLKRIKKAEEGGGLQIQVLQ